MHNDMFQMERYSSFLSKIYRLWYLECVKNLVFTQQSDILLLEAIITSERLRSIKITHYGICIQCDKASYFVKKLLLP